MSDRGGAVGMRQENVDWRGWEEVRFSSLVGNEEVD